ncbi:MAG: excinuclease ABC subunit UvrC [Clostridia bacterium]|nr:excinuclease ABC subunit UvrC [Clostridia bacterium]
MENERTPRKRDLAALRKKAASLPRSPGVYIMRDDSGKIIYVGKSRSLRDRVSSYFHGAHDVKTEKMASSVADFSFITCDTEMEAFAMENSLIKQHTPRYNIKLKDAKSYPYIKVTVKDEYPRIVMTRKRAADGSLYFGPYSSTSTVFSVISSLEKTFGIPSCRKKFPEDIGRGRPCVNYQIRRCLGVCAGRVTPEEYRAAIGDAVDVLRGDTAAVERKLENDMEKFSEELQFESAAKCRDTLSALRKLREKQKTVGSPETECDVIGLCTASMTEANHDSVSVYYIRGGCVSDSEHFLFDDRALTVQEGEDPPEESPLASFVAGLYRTREYIPKEILLSFELSEKDTDEVESFLYTLCGHRVTLRTPKRGASKYLCDMVVGDARSHTESKVTKTRAAEKTLFSLASLLSLEIFPERIEAYDISNLGSEHITAGMVVAVDGAMKKSEYRTFSIKGLSSPDDYASMRETLLRRVSHIEPGAPEGIGRAPDLILLDGGAGHVSVVREALDEAGYGYIPVFGMVKDDFHKTRTLISPDGECDISKQENVFRFIYGIQEEVHRFTIGRMKKAKRKTLRTSSLEKIPGIGPAKAKALLSHFKKLDAIRSANKEQLMSAPGIGAKDADAIVSYFKDKGKEKN